MLEDDRADGLQIEPQEVGAFAYLLADLLPGEVESQRVVHDSGLTYVELRTRFSDASLSRWLSIVSSLQDRADMDALLERVLAEGHDSDRLRQEVRRFRERHRARAAPVTAEEAPEQAHVAARWVPQPAPTRRLVDRQDIVTALRATLARSIAREIDGPVFLIGDAGVGKTRLAQECLQIAGSFRMPTLTAQCIDRHAEPLLPLRHCLASYRQHRSTSPRTLGAVSDDYTPFLDAFLGGAQAAPPTSLGGSAGRGVYEGLAQILLGLADPAGLCLVIEDLHDADDDTMSFLDYLGRESARTSLATVATITGSLLDSDSTDRIDRWRAAGWPVTVVPPFAREDATEFIALLDGERQLSSDVFDEVFALTGGNPFFIEQLMDLVDPRWSGLTGVPDRIDAVLTRRLRRLPPVLRRFIEAAAVALDVGHQLALVAHVAGIDDDTATDRLREAVLHRLLTVDADGTIGFAQKLLQRVLLDETLPNQRTARNIRAAEWLEQTQLYASASHHFALAGRTDDMVRTALRGAEQAEQRGAYATAIKLYTRARTAGDTTTIDLRLVRDHLILGQWAQAERALATITDDLGQVRVLRSHLHFVRGQFDRARRELRLASHYPDVDQAEATVRLADIHLYLGELRTGLELAERALPDFTAPTQLSLCHAVIGTCRYHMGDLSGADEAYIKELDVLPDEVARRDRFAYTMSLHNIGLAREARSDWEGARRFHEEALRIRLEVSAAREVGHSRHALIRCAVGVGDFTTARELLAVARTAATALGEDLEGAKLAHTDAQVTLLTGGDTQAAIRQIEDVREQFGDLQTTYDITHATFTLAWALHVAGVERRSLEEAASARAMLHRGEFGLLARLFPHLGFWYRARIAAGFLGYAAGDAVGLPWERMPPDQIEPDVLPSLHATDEWPAGATSDDTALTMLVATELATVRRADAVSFIRRLAAAPTIHGLGPSTSAAIASFQDTGDLPTGAGNTNGAVMRSLPVGWALPIDRAHDRRDWVMELSRATHPGAEARVAACVGAACAAWAIEGATPSMLLQIAREEAVAALRIVGSADARIAAMLTSVAAGTWQPDQGADGMDPYETIVRALWCVVRAPTPAEAVLSAVRLGGDTDTVAALVGGLVGCGMDPAEVRVAMPWISDVMLPDEDVVDRVAQELADLRVRETSG